MKNAIKPGHTLTLEPSADVLSGAVIMQGKIIGVAVRNALSGESVEADVEGCFELPKVTADVVTKGMKLNWNNTLKKFQIATSDVDGAATAIEAADGTKTVVKVRLTPV